MKIGLRDQIAMAALQGLLATGDKYHDDDTIGWQWYARAAYFCADAMLLAREENPRAGEKQ